MKQKYYTEDPEILGGTAVFYGTRVPVYVLFDYLSVGESVETFLDEFPSVSAEHVQSCLEASSERFKGNDEAAA
jgi:uncharacterized protein (DUF433 family)